MGDKGFIWHADGTIAYRAEIVVRKDGKRLPKHLIERPQQHPE